MLLNLQKASTVRYCASTGSIHRDIYEQPKATEQKSRENLQSKIYRAKSTEQENMKHPRETTTLPPIPITENRLVMQQINRSTKKSADENLATNITKHTDDYKSYKHVAYHSWKSTTSNGEGFGSSARPHHLPPNLRNRRKIVESRH
jgi:hypothetical protein